MLVNYIAPSPGNVRQAEIAKHDLGKVHNGNGNDGPEDMPEALMNRCPPEWRSSPYGLGPVWLKFLIFVFTEKRLLIRVEGDGRFPRG